MERTVRIDGCNGAVFGRPGGLRLPPIGFGTASLGEPAQQAAYFAICSGYRLIDTAQAYGSEDSYPEKNAAAWQAFEELKRNGKARHIGVCNFLERHLLQLTDNGMSCPEANQIELHPAYQQRGLVRFLRERGVTVEAWSPMGRGVLQTPEFGRMAASYGKDVGQLALRWGVQNGFVPLTRSSNPTHIARNLDIFDFEISEDDMQSLNGLNTNTNYLDIWSYKRQQMY